MRESLLPIICVLTMLFASAGAMKEQAARGSGKALAPDDTIQDLLNHPAFAGFSRLLLPWDDRTYDQTMRLRNLDALLPYHSHVDPRTVVSALNRMIDDVNSGNTILYEFYTPAEKKEQPDRSHTGLFFFRGKPGACYFTRDMRNHHGGVVLVDVLGVDTQGYSLWGSSAGARMAAAIGSHGAAKFGGDDVARPAA